MDLVTGIFKQKIAAFLLFVEVFLEYAGEPLVHKGCGGKKRESKFSCVPAILERESTERTAVRR